MQKVKKSLIIEEALQAFLNLDVDNLRYKANSTE